MEKIAFLEQAFKIYEDNMSPELRVIPSPTVDHIIVLVEQINQLKKRVADLENDLKERPNTL